MICLFGPKIYALFWVPDDQIQTSFKDEATESKMNNKSMRETWWYLMSDAGKMKYISLY